VCMSVDCQTHVPDFFIIIINNWETLYLHEFCISTNDLLSV
jgi:hypothetical protein